MMVGFSESLPLMVKIRFGEEQLIISECGTLEEYPLEIGPYCSTELLIEA